MDGLEDGGVEWTELEHVTRDLSLMGELGRGTRFLGGELDGILMIPESGTWIVEQVELEWVLFRTKSRIK